MSPIPKAGCIRNWGTAELRQALTQAVDRRTLATALFGEGTKPPPGPMSQLLWIWDDGIRQAAV